MNLHVWSLHRRKDAICFLSPPLSMTVSSKLVSSLSDFKGIKFVQKFLFKEWASCCFAYSYFDICRRSLDLLLLLVQNASGMVVEGYLMFLSCGSWLIPVEIHSILWYVILVPWLRCFCYDLHSGTLRVVDNFWISLRGWDIFLFC